MLLDFLKFADMLFWRRWFSRSCESLRILGVVTAGGSLDVDFELMSSLGRGWVGGSAISMDRERTRLFKPLEEPAVVLSAEQRGGEGAGGRTTGAEGAVTG